MHAISYLAGITRTPLVSRVVSVLHGLRHRRARVQIAVATLSGNSLRQTVHTNRASVHQAAKLVIALLRVAGVTAGLAESNGSLSPGFMIHITCRLTAKNRDQLRNPTLGNRVWATFTFFSFYHWLPIRECQVRSGMPGSPVAVRAGASLLGRRLPSRVRQHSAPSALS